MLGLEKSELIQGPQGLLPVDWNGLKSHVHRVSDAKSRVIHYLAADREKIPSLNNFLRKWYWGDLDFLIIDFPSGNW
jgi:hypothetical protein